MPRHLPKASRLFLKADHPLMRVARDVRYLNEAIWQRVREQAETAMEPTLDGYRLPHRLGQRMTRSSTEEVKELAGLGPIHFRVANTDEVSRWFDAPTAQPGSDLDAVILAYWTTVRDYGRFDRRACSMEFGMPTALVARVAEATLETLSLLARSKLTQLHVVGETHLEFLANQLQLQEDEVRLVNTTLALYASLPSVNPQSRQR